MRGASIAGLVSLVLLVTASDTPAPFPHIETVWKSDLNVISEPRVAGGDGDVIVAYIVEGLDLYLVAVGADTGQEIWRRPSSFSGIPSGTILVPSVVEGNPVYYWPGEEEDYSQLVVADPHTGADMALTDYWRGFASLPMDCGDNVSTTVCIRTTSSIWEKVDIADGEWLSMEEAFPPLDFPDSPGARYGRLLGPKGLVSIEADESEYLTVYDPANEGSEPWVVSLSELLGEQYSYNQSGRPWAYVEDADLYIGTVLPPPVDDEDSESVPETQMVALERATGRVAWIEEGADYGCNNTLSNAAVGESTQSHHDGAGNEVTTFVRCRVEGTIESWFYVNARSSDSYQVWLEGFDPVTGEVTWSVPLDGYLPFFGKPMTGQPIVRGPGDNLVISRGGQSEAIGLTSGQVQPVGDNETFWCGMEVMFEAEGSVISGSGERNYTRTSSPLYEWCDASGRPVPEGAPAPRFVPNGVGVQSGDLRVISMSDGLAAYRVP